WRRRSRALRCGRLTEPGMQRTSNGRTNSMPPSSTSCARPRHRAGRGEPMSVAWQSAGTYDDILYEKAEGIAKITINRPEVHNSFRPHTLDELAEVFRDAAEDNDIGVVLFTGAGDRAFCAGGDQRIRGDAGYLDEKGSPSL